MATPTPLFNLTQGINRLRVKGGADPEQLYDLVNGYIQADGSIAQREGTIRSETLDSSTVGLCAMDGVFNVFATSLQSVPSGYACNVLVNPTNPSDALVKIWFAQPFMGFLFVVAEFASGDIFHYWLQYNGSWTANTVYETDNIVIPDTPNGLGYLAVRDMPQNPLWTAQTQITSGSLIEPNEYNGYCFKAVAVEGVNPHTSSTEPSWPSTSGAIIQEFGDFDTSTSDSGTFDGSVTSTGPMALGANITDRYGDSADIAGLGTVTSSSIVLPTAQTKVTIWAKGTLYAPGAVVQPTTDEGAFVNAIPNGDFENGNDGNWVLSGSPGNVNSVDFIDGTGLQYEGEWALVFRVANTQQSATMFNFGTCTPGQSITASCYLNPDNSGANLTMFLALNWYDHTDSFLSATNGAHQQGGGYRKVSLTATAPAGAVHVRLSIIAGNGTGTEHDGYADLASWNLETPAAISNFLYEAVQTAAGASGSSEPLWPTIEGTTVIDGGVTWEAIGTSIITWEAIPIMLSGATEPTFPTTVGTTVNDPSSFTDQNGAVTSACSMSWQCTTRQITDTNDPNTAAVCLGASHVFAANNDICSYCAAVNPTDWTSANNAGYLPTGLNNYGANPIMVLALFRGNLVVLNAGGYQMWQIDPDPANMALLDAQPVGSIYPRAAQSIANDLLILTEVGVRNISTVGATANMQIGQSGQPVDPLVKAQLAAGTYEPRSLYYPGRGQYWLFFGPQAFVFTVNGEGLKTWSRYVFPDTITDWTLNAGFLYLRTAGNLVWQINASAVGVDDSGGANTAFQGVIQTPYVDSQDLGTHKMLIGVDLVGTGQVYVQVAFNENDPTSFSDNGSFSSSTSVTAPYLLSAADTLPGQPIPIPCMAASYSLILTFPGAQAWSWQASNMYMNKAKGGGQYG